MTDHAASARQIARAARRDVAPAPRNDGQARLPVRIDLPGARVRLLPGRFCGAEDVARHVQFVLGRDAEQGEKHVQRNLRAIRRTLQEIGVEDDAIEAELRTIEAAVRAEIWKHVLLPDGQP